MLLQFCQLVKKLSYFFKPAAIQFAFMKFKEHVGSSDKQLAWAYLTMFTPFRSDIQQHHFAEVIVYVSESENYSNDEKENCRLRFMLNYMRVYPRAERSESMVGDLLK